MNARRGMTLIEMIVVAGVLVVVLGLTLGIASESEKATRNITRRQQALQYCQSALENASATVRGAVDPRSLDAANLTGQLHFTQNALTVASYDGDQEPALRLVTLRAKAPSEQSPASLERYTQVLNPATGQVSQERREPLVRMEAEAINPTIRFAYAAGAEPGQAVAWADAWSSPSLPRLVQITVEAAVREDQTTRSVRLQTAVIPAVLGGAR